jgi:hypothetical protein
VIGCCCQPLSVSLITWSPRQRMAKRYLGASILSFRLFMNCSEKQPSSGFAWIWIGVRFVNKCSQTQNHHYFHHLSSPYVIIFEESHHLFQPRSESKLFCFLPWFCQALLDFAKPCSEFSLLVCINFTMRITV